jgi:uncharacterized protein YndB with AHSA1/START domain
VINKFTTSTQNSKNIKAAPEAIYEAFTNPEALTVWLAPGEMTGRITDFDLRVGGGYQMSLFYPPSEIESRGKTSEKEDRFNARFVELTPYKKIIQTITFDSANPDFSGVMIMEVTFEPNEIGTRVTFLFKDIPSGIRPEDNEAGTLSTLEKLAGFLECNVQNMKTRMR